MTDHAQIIRLALKHGLAALAALEAELEDWKTSADLNLYRAEKAEAERDRLREALRKIANGEAALRQEAVARAALGEDDPDPDAGSHPQEIAGSFEP